MEYDAHVRDHGHGQTTFDTFRDGRYEVRYRPVTVSPRGCEDVYETAVRTNDAAEAERLVGRLTGEL